MGTKERPGTFDCYDAAEPDEPMFTLLARDESAPELVEGWAIRRYRRLLERPPLMARDLRKVAEALQCANNMRRWKRAHP